MLSSTSSSFLRRAVTEPHPATVVVLASVSVISLIAHLVDVALAVRFIHICVIRPALLRCIPFLERTASTPKCTADAFLRQHLHFAKVTTRDCDLMFHMNNARYPREADFARHELFVACGLFDVCWRRRTPLVTAAQSIRYRRELSFGSHYIIRTRVVGWDHNSIFLEQAFLTTHCHGGRKKQVVHAVLLVKETVAVGNKKEKYPLPLTSAMAALGWTQAGDEIVCSSSSSHTLSPPLPEIRHPPQDVEAWLHSLNQTNLRTTSEVDVENDSKHI